MSKAEREAFVAGATWHNIPTTTVLEAPAEALRRYPDKPCKNVREIVDRHCVDEGYHGLFNKGRNCWCILGPSIKGTQPWACCECVCGDCKLGVLRKGEIVAKEGE